MAVRAAQARATTAFVSRFEVTRTGPFIGCVLALGVAAPVWASGGLSVSDAWMRGMPEGIPSGGYFTLHNRTANEVVLTGASTPACASLMLHQSQDMGGMSSMRHVDQVQVPAGGSIAFQPGGYHLMCIKATPAIHPGARILVTLIFQDGTKLAVPFAVRNAAGK
jgi:periplasmic copper chaperone A